MQQGEDELLDLINQLFPDNKQRLITPARLRNAFRDVIQSTWNNVDYPDLDSGGGSGGPAIPNIDTPYDDITALLADQAEQDTGVMYLVADAAADDRIISGAAIYAKGATSTADLEDDYVLVASGDLPALVQAMAASLLSALDDITDLQANKEDAFSKNTAFNKDFGTTAGTVAAGDHNHSGVYEPVISPKNTAFNLNKSSQAEEEAGVSTAVVSTPSGHGFFWAIKKAAAETLGGIWRFTNGVEASNVKVSDAGTYKKAISSGVTSAQLDIADDPSFTAISFKKAIAEFKNVASATKQYIITAINGTPSATIEVITGFVDPATVGTTYPVSLQSGTWSASAMNYETLTRDGEAKQYSFDSSYIYECITTDTWVRTLNSKLFSVAANTLMPATETTASTYTFPANSVAIGYIFSFDYFGGLFASETINIRFKLNGATWFTYSTPTTGPWKCNVEMAIINTNTAALLFEFKTSTGIILDRYNVTFTFASSNTISLTTESLSDSTISIYKALGRRLA